MNQIKLILNIECYNERLHFQPYRVLLLLFLECPTEGESRTKQSKNSNLQKNHSNMLARN